MSYKRKRGSGMSYSASRIGRMADLEGAQTREQENARRIAVIAGQVAGLAPGQVFPGQSVHGSYKRGSYAGMLGSAARSAGRAAFEAGGGALGGSLGGMLGNAGYGSAAGASVGRFMGQQVFGRGGYETNSLFQSGSGLSVPSFSSSGDETGAITINHREYVADVNGTTDFTVSAYQLNPSNQSLFPWLSQIAANYEEYEFNGLIASFRTTTADISSSTASIGTVIMACDYNAGASDFTTKIQMLNYDASVDVKVSCDLMFGFECDPTKNGLGGILYVAGSQGSVPTGQDIKTYNMGNFQVATNGCENTGQVGELWMSYSIVLRKPKLVTTVGTVNPFSAFYAGFGPSVGVPLINIPGTLDPITSEQHLYSDTGVVATSSPSVVRFDERLMAVPQASLWNLNDYVGSYFTPPGWSYLLAASPYFGLNQFKIRYTFPPTIQAGNYLFTIVWDGLSRVSPEPDKGVAHFNETTQGLIAYGGCSVVDVAPGDGTFGVMSANGGSDAAVVMTPMPMTTGTDTLCGANRVGFSTYVSVVENTTGYNGGPFIATAIEGYFNIDVDPSSTNLPLYPSTSLFASGLVMIPPRIFGSVSLSALPVKLSE